MCISDYRVWTEIGKGEEKICKEKSVSELSVLVLLLLLLLLLYLCVIIYYLCYLVVVILINYSVFLLSGGPKYYPIHLNIIKCPGFLGFKKCNPFVNTVIARESVMKLLIQQ